MENKGWYAFWLSLVFGFFIWFGLYLFTDKLLASSVLAFGIYGVVYYICVGMGVLTQRVTEIEAQIPEAQEHSCGNHRKKCGCDEKK